MKLPPFSSFLSRPIFIVSALALAASFFLPVQGFGPPACGFLLMLRRPCFGCGMTRALTSISHFEWDLAWHYHPFSYLLWPLMFLMALGCIPRVGRYLKEDLIRKNDRILSPLFWFFLALFFLYGLWRILFCPHWPS